MHVSSVVGKCGVQCAEGITASVEITAKMRFEHAGIAVDLLCQPIHIYSRRQLANGREITHEAPVDEHQLARGAFNAEWLYLFVRQSAILRQLKRSPCNRGDVCKPPVLVMRVRETYLAETSECIFAQLPKPWQISPRSTFLEFSEALQIDFQLLGCCNHVLLVLSGGNLAGFAFDLPVTLFFKFQRQLRPARTHNAPVYQDVNEVRDYVVQETLIVGNDDNRTLRTSHCVDAVGHDSERVNVEPRIGFVEDRQFRFQHGHLQNLVTLLLPAG